MFQINNIISTQVLMHVNILQLVLKSAIVIIWRLYLKLHVDQTSFQLQNN